MFAAVNQLVFGLLYLVLHDREAASPILRVFVRSNVQLDLSSSLTCNTLFLTQTRRKSVHAWTDMILSQPDFYFSPFAKLDSSAPAGVCRFSHFPAGTVDATTRLDSNKLSVVPILRLSPPAQSRRPEVTAPPAAIINPLCFYYWWRGHKMFITLAELGWREEGSGRAVRDGRAMLLKGGKTASGGSKQTNRPVYSSTNK